MGDINGLAGENRKGNEFPPSLCLNHRAKGGVAGDISNLAAALSAFRRGHCCFAPFHLGGKTLSLEDQTLE